MKIYIRTKDGKIIYLHYYSFNSNDGYYDDETLSRIYERNGKLYILEKIN